MLAPSRLYDLFQNVNKFIDYNLRGSPTRVCIPMPKTEYCINTNLQQLELNCKVKHQHALLARLSCHPASYCLNCFDKLRTENFKIRILEFEYVII